MQRLTRFLRAPEVQTLRGRKHASHYADIKAGLCTPGVRVGANAVGWPDYEVEAINAARIAGRTDEEIRALVQELLAARRQGA